MKKIILYPICILILLSCYSNSKQNDTLNQENHIEILEKDSMRSLYNIPIDSFISFQTFCESRMKGVGIVKDSPFVYVHDKGNLILVRISNNIDSLIVYQKRDSYWINEHRQNMELRDSFIDKDWTKEYPSLYKRMIYGDSIIELRQIFMNDDTLDYLIIKDTSQVVVLGLLDDIKNYSFPYMEMKKIVSHFNKHGNLNVYNPNYINVKRLIRKYKIYKGQNYILFQDWDKEHEKSIRYNLSSLQDYNLFPDF